MVTQIEMGSARVRQDSKTLWEKKRPAGKQGGLVSKDKKEICGSEMPPERQRWCPKGSQTVV